jgi:hypothetical protein
MFKYNYYKVLQLKIRVGFIRKINLYNFVVKMTEITFGSDPIRFEFCVFTNKIGLPNKLDYPVKDLEKWSAASINHEELHRVLFELEGDNACRSLDNFEYRTLECGHLESYRPFSKRLWKY